MSSCSLKLIALITMLIDHFGAIFFPGIAIFRIIGRIAFPLYAFMLAEGCHYTHNIRKYLARLLVFAFISEIPFNLMESGKFFDFQYQNIYFTLFLGGLAIYCYQLLKKRGFGVFVTLLPAVPAIVLGYLLRVDYSFYGVALIFAFYVLREWFHQNNLVCLILIPFALFQTWWLGNTVFLFAMLPIIPLLLYNKRRGPKLPKYLFYSFYPAHILLFYLISLMIAK